MIEAIDVVKTLSEMGLDGIKLIHDKAKGFYYDLNTGAKSHLYLYDDFHVEGRYDYHQKIDSAQEMDEILSDLFWEFRNCIKGRDFYNDKWMEIGVKLGLIEKIVETHTTVRYV